MAHRKNSEFIDQLNAALGADQDEAVEASDDAAEQTKSSSEDFAKLLGESFKSSARKLSVGDKLHAKILVIGQEDVWVATGTQNDGLLSKRELIDESGGCPFKVDDVIDVYVTQVRGSDVRVSRNPTDKNLAEDLEDAFDMMLPVQGRVVEVCKGGVRVNLKGKLAFCPISQLDAKHVETSAIEAEYVGRSFEFRITQFSEGGRNIVVSRRKLLEEERELNQGSFLEEHKDGEIVPGKVARLEKFGAFVELAPGVDGLVHISEIAWSRIGDPSEILQVGQEVQVKILKRETINNRVKISLSIKQAMPKEDRAAASAKPGEAGAEAKAASPWAKYSVGQVVTGKINRKELYGLFIQLEPGITGLLHKSKAIEHPEFHYEKLKLGDEVTVQIDEIRLDDRRISLGLPRDPNEDDWRKHVQAQPAASSFGTLADKLQAALSSSKSSPSAKKKS